MIFDFDREPDFVNPEGVKWWLDKSSTQYARRENIRGTTLPTITVFMCEFPDKTRSYVILDGTQPVDAPTTLEAVGVKIDLLKLMKESE